jgi:hypothetical protein
VGWYEFVGYAGSALIVLSLMMRSLLRLRLINLVGAAIFPVWAVNAAIVLIDVWELRRMLGADERLEVLEVDPDGAYVRRFLDFHADEIGRFVPGFSGVQRGVRGFFVLRDLVPAALVLTRIDGPEALVDLDYAIPTYRDFTSGEYVYTGAMFAELGVATVVSDGGNHEYERYLRRMGFRPDGDRWRRGAVASV